MGDIQRERVTTANRVEVYLSGDGERKLLGKGATPGRLGEATDASINQNTGLHPVHTIGSADPIDHVDGAHTNEVSLTLLRLVSRESADEINAGPVDIDYVDRFGKRFKRAEECKLQGAGIQVSANNLVTRNLRFMALRVS